MLAHQQLPLDPPAGFWRIVLGMSPYKVAAREALGPARELVLEPAGDCDLRDAAQLGGGHTPGVIRPASEADVAEALQRFPAVLPVGARSSVTGGATPMGAVVLSLARFDTMAPLGPDRVRVGAGVSLQALNAWLAERDRHFPPVPSYALAQVGGAISTNAAGPNTFKYGATRRWIDGLRVVLASGDVLDLARGQCRANAQGRFEIATRGGTLTIQVPDYRPPAVPKVSAGYFAAAEMDLVDLFIGAEGTLGVITAATLRVVPDPRPTQLALVPCRDEATAFRLNRELRGAALAGDLVLNAIEYVDARALALAAEYDPEPVARLDLDPGLTVLILHAEAPLNRAEVDWITDPDLADAILAVRAAVPQAVNARVTQAQAQFGAGITKIAADMIVPFEHFETFTAASRQAFTRRGLDHAIWGHSSDGNLHPNLIPHQASDMALGRQAVLEMGELAIALGGSPLAEHGVGRNPVKQRLLALLYGEAGMAQMRAVKHALDPQSKLAPGVLF